MGLGITVPVLAGLVAGVIFITAISYAFRPYIARSDSEIWDYVNSLPEAQAFKERYPDAEGKIWREYYFSGIRYLFDSGKYYVFHVTLAANKQIQNDDDRPYVRTLGLTFVMGYSALERTSLGCGPMPTYKAHVTVEDIRTNECLGL